MFRRCCQRYMLLFVLSIAAGLTALLGGCASEDQSRTAQSDRPLRGDQAVQAGGTLEPEAGQGAAKDAALPQDNDLYGPRDYTGDYSDWNH